ncbi:MAG: NUDIX domain-containing protein [Nocardioidaceae bacterium]|nr:NUDIX domain-containing protein [Nocardioidaceae bacterium]
MQVVVGAAVVRDGRVLACRRRYPPEAAGRWELPGGKAEDGEKAEVALAREIREELGCEVAVGRRLAGAEKVRDGLELWAYVATLVDGEPVPHEHDAARWLAPEELDDVDWLVPDRPFLAELREVLLDGTELVGGNVGGAVRIGRTVRRPVGPWTPAVHRVLGLARERGVPCVPRVLGEDARGREVLDYLPGTIVDVDDELLTDGQLAAAARWLRRLHDAMAGEDVNGPWRWFDVPAPTVIGHNDVAPYNLCFEGDHLTGVFDWDLAGPTTPAFELAHLAWTGVPLFRERPADEVARRLRILERSYEGPCAAGILGAVFELKRLAVDGINAWIAGGDPAGRAQAAAGEPARTEEALAALAERRPGIEEALR